MCFKPGFLLLCHISIADLFYLAAEFVDDFTKTYTNVTSHNVPILCDIYRNVKSTSGRAATFMTMAMTIERFYATYYTFSYRKVVTTNKLNAVAFGSAVYGFFAACMQNIAFGNENGFCFLQRSGYNILIYTFILSESIVMSHAIPSVTVAVLNILIVLRIKRRNTTQRLVPDSFKSKPPESKSFDLLNQSRICGKGVGLGLFPSDSL